MFPAAFAGVLFLGFIEKKRRFITSNEPVKQLCIIKKKSKETWSRCCFCLSITIQSIIFEEHFSHSQIVFYNLPCFFLIHIQFFLLSVALLTFDLRPQKFQLCSHFICYLYFCPLLSSLCTPSCPSLKRLCSTKTFDSFKTCSPYLLWGKYFSCCFSSLHS